MNALTRWNQLKDLEDLQHTLGSLFGRSKLRWSAGEEKTTRVADWNPLVDISEDAEEYLIKIELTEVKKEDVKITIEDGILTIAGDRKFAKVEKGKRHHRVERAYGSFGRSFSLPDDASPAKVTADLKDGVLNVHLAKNKKARSSKSRPAPFDQRSERRPASPVPSSRANSSMTA
jgi:HSP20 family protein